MATGSAWHLEDQKRPWALMDPDSKLTYPLYIGDWLDGLGDVYSPSTSVTADPPLQIVLTSYAADVRILHVRIQLLDGAPFVAGQLYPFTIHLVGAAGQVDDRTLWLLVDDR